MLAKPRMAELETSADETMYFTEGRKSSSVLVGVRQAPPWMKLEYRSDGNPEESK